MILRLLISMWRRTILTCCEDPDRKERVNSEPFKSLIDQWLTEDLNAKPKQRHTAQRVYDRLKELFKDEFNISDRAVRKYVSQRKKELYVNKEGYLP